MNHKRITYIMPHAPVEGTPVKRRRRSKLMFQEERQSDMTEAELSAEEDYRHRQAEKRGIKP